jgi:hypothetical protein
MHQDPNRPGVTLQAIFSRAVTTTDGGWNLTFSVASNEAAQVLQIAQLRDMVLQLAVIPVEIQEWANG